MAKSNKTVATQEDPWRYIASVGDPDVRADCELLMQTMQRIVGEPPKMWGPSIIGFGSYHYKYGSGREGDFLVAGFAPRKHEISVYLMGDIPEQAALLQKLGKHRMGKACLYIRKLNAIDMKVLEELITRSVAAIREKYPSS